ncbi:hypothetical protein [Namhaeicola litoreus]|uniref:EamA-like transporter family protein n=1 Tax=Namhaeicola litoreus TaxID=1052145 RepID=A0ABW3Y2L5_9FLAO
MELRKVLLVFSTVLVTLISALLLNYGAKMSNSLISPLGIGIISVVILVNFLKFVIWGKVYKKYDLSKSYPLVSLFFPLLYAVALYKGDAELKMTKVVGVCFILTGVWFMSRKVNI